MNNAGKTTRLRYPVRGNGNRDEGCLGDGGNSIELPAVFEVVYVGFFNDYNRNPPGHISGFLKVVRSN